jgi:hypothetical protein
MMPMAGALVRNSNKPDRRIKLRKQYDGGEFLRLVLSTFTFHNLPLATHAEQAGTGGT